MNAPLGPHARVVRVLELLLLCATVLVASPAGAHGFMVRHGYTGCRPCHVDPSGGGALTAYGRGMGEELLHTPYAEAAREPGRSAEFLWGLARGLSPLELGGDGRILLAEIKPEGVPLTEKVIVMQADLEATLELGGFVASGSLGYAPEGALGAAITRGPERNLVSRQHWLGYGAPDASWLVRLGRMNLPFGLRSVEHTFWARSLTATNSNDQQQYGLAFAFDSGALRGEVMLIGGNLQLRPDAYRERGYSAALEWFALPKLALGVSSLVTHRKLHPDYLLETWRQAHGAFVRWGTPFEPLVLALEGDYVMSSPKHDQWREGPVGYVQADLEAAQGVHLIATLEAHAVGIDSPPASYGAWLSYAWFFAPHADLRIDNVYQSLGSDYGRMRILMLLAQAHFYL
jgi:hypothetical protein